MSSNHEIISQRNYAKTLVGELLGTLRRDIVEIERDLERDEPIRDETYYKSIGYMTQLTKIMDRYGRDIFL